MSDMDNKPINIQKYENYKEQFKRLKMAMSHCFYLEAMFICYAIMEDRTESILVHAGKWDAYLKKRGRYQVTIDSKIKYIKSFSTQKNSLTNKYFGDEILDEIIEWKDERNRIMHALMKQNLTTEELESLASRGEMLAKTITNRSGSFTKALERAKKKRVITFFGDKEMNL